ncbi:MAG: acyl-CoA synthetase FdrA [Desulfobacteraceae bacterium]|jgi:succinyl-CoA synthetase alpha subunit
MKEIKIKQDAYYDSVFLMLASKHVKAASGVCEVVASMGTKTNIALMADIGFDAAVLNEARPNDLIIAVKGDSREIIDGAFAAVDEFLSKSKDLSDDEEAYCPVNLSNAIRFSPESNMVLISIPGEYAAREARIALDSGLHVLMFSDNVSIEDEITLKQLAVEKGLLMMGPDCGTAIINGTPLCFANAVSRGNIGLVAASGSGLQEVTCCIDKLGGGISQALGTGGRDLKDPRIGGMMMKMGIRALKEDTATDVIVVISKPPAQEVADDILNDLKQTGKPCVVSFLGQGKREKDGNLWFAQTLEEAAILSVERSGADMAAGQDIVSSGNNNKALISEQVRTKTPTQKFIRGLFAGGTLADEARIVLQDRGLEIYSNIQTDKKFKLADPKKAREHTLIDLGDDAFTVGRPHPMIDPSIRQEQLAVELADPEVAVVLMDFVIGYGAHEDPAAPAAEFLLAAQEDPQFDMASKTVIASITGTKADFQDISRQRKQLEAAGCIVMSTNAKASRLAADIIQGITK